MSTSGLQSSWGGGSGGSAAEGAIKSIALATGDPITPDTTGAVSFISPGNTIQLVQGNEPQRLLMNAVAVVAPAGTTVGGASVFINPTVVILKISGPSVSAPAVQASITVGGTTPPAEGLYVGGNALAFNGNPVGLVGYGIGNLAVASPPTTTYYIPTGFPANTFEGFDSAPIFTNLQKLDGTTGNSILASFPVSGGTNQYIQIELATPLANNTAVSWAVASDAVTPVNAVTSIPGPPPS